MSDVLVHTDWIFVAVHRGVSVWKPQMPDATSCMSILLPIWPLIRIEIAFPKWIGTRP